MSIAEPGAEGVLTETEIRTILEAGILPGS